MAGNYDLYAESAALDFVLTSPRAQVPARKRPRILAFVRDWSPQKADPLAVHQLASALDIDIVVLANSGVWQFTPDHELGSFSDRIAGDVATAAMLHGVRDGRDAVFQIDTNGSIRFISRTLAATLAELAAHGDAAGRADRAVIAQEAVGHAA